jgi:glucose-1-phosphate cytidylyltransferase
MIGVILCGGFGTRLNNGKRKKILKPLLKLNGKPIIKYIIDDFKKNNINEIILLGGYKIKDLNKYIKKLKDNKIKVVNTGLRTDTAGRLLRAKKIIGNKEFIFTYGDTLVQANLKRIIRKKNKKNFIFSYFKYKIPYGVYEINKKSITKMYEKNYDVMINSGYYFLDRRVFKFIRSRNDSFEKKIIPKIIKSNLIAIDHFETNNWMPVDTYHNKIIVEKYIKNNK